ncbi:hypothetical protein Xsto_02996 [Xenorhabdus stockiae]|uniref:Uncharacterized protein n=1 Tax=Xenorhabdus stockiae TaxID=351614 RepID=A0A2D0KLZ1_9GAMM|nr:hypothetical protein Xsto_02996 [Xenorhabdus stockiae]
MKKEDKVLFLFEQTIKVIEMKRKNNATSLSNIQHDFDDYYSELELLLDEKLLESGITVK